MAHPECLSHAVKYFQEAPDCSLETHLRQIPLGWSEKPVEVIASMLKPTLCYIKVLSPLPGQQERLATIIMRVHLDKNGCFTEFKEGAFDVWIEAKGEMAYNLTYVQSEDSPNIATLEQVRQWNNTSGFTNLSKVEEEAIKQELLEDGCPDKVLIEETILHYLSRELTGEHIPPWLLVTPETSA